ncbi:MAG: N-6 DNA methylase [Chloroflexi bacterium]|nr:N-6 DNA methylase [Chloroflexota bacterium]
MKSFKAHGKIQQLLFAEDTLLPDQLPRAQELQPAPNLSTIFDECHNYIYANEGLLKDKIFYEMVKLLVVKLHDEQPLARGALEFGITASEYRNILANRPSTFEKRINKLFASIRDRYRGLFSDDTIKLKSLTLAFVVGRLQFVNLAQTPGDVKGEAFQAFVYRHQRGDRGEFFTPHPIVRLAVEMIAPQPNERVIDPACGSGGFLIQTIHYIQRQHPDVDKSDYVQNHIAGIEFNPDVALSAMVRLAFEGGTGAEITCANTLIENQNLENTFDVVLTNPPFGSKGKVEDQKILKSYILARRWNRTRNDAEWEATRNVLAGQSPDILFIEKCLKLLRPGGRMAIVLPDGILQNISNSHIRFWLRAQAKVLGVVSIPQEAFIPYGTGIKTSLLVLQKLPVSNHRACFMARMQKVGYDVKGQPIYQRDESGRLIKTSAGLPSVDDDVEKIATRFAEFQRDAFASNTEDIFIVPASSLNSRLDAEHYRPDDQTLIEHLKSIGAKPLGAIADILTETDDFRLVGDSEIRYIAIADVDARTMQVVAQQIMPAHEAPSRATYRVRAGDIITATAGASTGTARQATALITEDEDSAICSNGFAVLRNIHGVAPLFLLAYMRTEFYLRQVRRLMTGHAIPAISTDDLSKVLVPIPAKQDQARIADIIAEIQSMRKNARQAGEKVVAETNSLVSQLG